MIRRRKPPVIVRVAGSRREPPQPWPHQTTTTARAVRDRRLMLHCAMRSGKSRMAIDACEALGLRRVLVVGPKVTVSVWEDQVQRWARHDWTVALLDERAGTCARKAAVVRALQGDRIAVVCNYESAWRPVLADALRAWDPDAIVLDESQRVASPQGKAARWAREMGAGRREIVLGLTGTPGEPHKLWSQYAAIRPGTLPRSYREHVARFVVTAQREIRLRDGRTVRKEVPVGGKNIEELGRLLAPATVRVANDVMDLVPATHQVVRVELSPDGRRAYDEMEELMRARLDRGEITAKNSLSALLRLQQITGGCVPNDEGTPVRVDTAKRDALRELVEDSDPDEPLVVVARFLADLDAAHEVARELGRGSCELSGRRRDLEAWRSGGPPILAAQIRAGGIGIDLTRAAWCVFYSTGFSLEDYEQSVARIHGPEQRRHVHYDALVARDTIDEAVYGALRKKARVVDAVVDGYLKAQVDVAT